MNDFTNHRHGNDAISVQRIVEELQQEDISPVIAYKALGVKNDSCPLLREESFLLAIMTEFQAALSRNSPLCYVLILRIRQMNTQGKICVLL